MKAVVWTKYGSPDGLQLMEVEKPTPKDNEVLIRIHAATVTAADCEMRAFKGFGALWLVLRIYIGIFRPMRIKILGQELAGVIEATGRDVTRFKIGDPVFAWSALQMGGYAEYACLDENTMMAIKPGHLTFEQVAPVPVGGIEAWNYLRGNVRTGQKVLIVGAGGSIGSFGVQIAKYLGAEVTAVDRTGKLEMLRSIGADRIIDFTREDFTNSGESFDVIFDAPGKTSYLRCKKLLKPGGVFFSASPKMPDKTLAKLFGQRRLVLPETPKQRKEYFDSLADLIASGKIKSIIDRVYPLGQTPDAHRYAETDQKKGNIVIKVA